MRNATAIILAGGKSSRMGSDKGLTLLNGVPMIQHVIKELEKLKLPIVIIANNSDYRQFGYPVINDLVVEKGPVGGIYTALHTSKTETNLILSCDAPFINKEILTMLLNSSEGYDATISSYCGKQHPLIGVYNKTSIHQFKDSLGKDQLRLREVNKLLKTNIVEFTDEDPFVRANMFSNINTPEELEKNKA